MAWRGLGGIAPSWARAEPVRRSEKQNSRRPVRKRRELWERWCEAGKCRVSLQGPMLNSSPGNPVSARRFSGQRTRVAYSKRAIKHWGIGFDRNVAGEGLGPLCGEPIGGRYRPSTLHQVQGQLPRPSPPHSERLFAAMSELRSHHLFRRRGDRSQRPDRASRCQTVAPGASPGG